eukprot:2329708-Rhodomonas_salina.1
MEVSRLGFGVLGLGSTTRTSSFLSKGLGSRFGAETVGGGKGAAGAALSLTLASFSGSWRPPTRQAPSAC